MKEPIRIEMPTPFSVGPVNAFLFLEPEPVLVDCGFKMEMCEDALKAGLAEHGLTFSDIKQVIITHAHVDHAGLAGVFAEAGATIWASDVAYDWVQNVKEMWQSRVDILADTLQKGGAPEDNIRIGVGFMSQMPEIWSAAPAESIKRFPIDGELTFGGRTWQVIYAPGHTRTQTCFFEPNTGWFLSADMLLPIAPPPVLEADENGERIPGLVEFVEVMAQIRSLQISKIFPGHGPIMENHHELIDKQMARIEMRREECFGFVKEGGETIFGITEKMYTHLPPAARGLGFGMVIGYLDLLMAAGRVNREFVDGVWRFSVT